MLRYWPFGCRPFVFNFAAFVGAFEKRRAIRTAFICTEPFFFNILFQMYFKSVISRARVGEMRGRLA